MARWSTKAGLVLGTAMTGIMWAAPAQAQDRVFDIPAQSANTAIPEIARQAGIQIVASGDQLRDKRTKAVKGTMDVRTALRLALDGTGLTTKFGSDNSVAIVPFDYAATDASDGAVPEVVVTGRRSLNSDVRRTEDDPQPYVVFTAKDLADSQAATPEEFLRTRLPMNTQVGMSTQNLNTIGSNSNFTLRGLNTNQTLVLVDGRRRAGILNRATNANDIGQPDINGIPVSAIERIEVLPAGAGGIYGGGAVGGVINIILKRGHRGIDVGFTYGDSGDFKVPTRRFDVSGGFRIGDSTQVSFSGSYSNGGNLLVGERDLVQRGRAKLLANNPVAYASLFTPPAGATANIRTVSGANLVLKNGMTFPNPSPFTSVPAGFGGYTGLTSDVSGLIANAGKYNLDLPDDSYGLRRSLMSNPEIVSLNGTIERNFGDRLRVFVDGSYSWNKAVAVVPGLQNFVTLQPTAANNPFTQPVFVVFPSPLTDGIATSTSTMLSLTGGFTYKLGGGWAVSADHNWSRSTSRSKAPSPVFLNGVSAPLSGAGGAATVVDVLRDPALYPQDYSAYQAPYPGILNDPADITMNDTNLRLSGPLLKLPGGPLTFTSLLEYRKQVSNDAWNYQYFGGQTPFALTRYNATTGTIASTVTLGRESYYYRPQRSQSTASAYAELRAPIVSPANHIPFINALEIQASVRYDRYRTDSWALPLFQLLTRDLTGIANNPAHQKVSATKFTAGASWKPIKDLQLRVSYATAFLPPSISQIGPQVTIADQRVVDPLIPSATVPPIASSYVASLMSLTQGGSLSLKPEESTTLSFGAILTPSFLPGFRLSADYTRIRKTDEITSFGYQVFVTNESLFPGRVVRSTTVRPGEPVGRVTAVDASLINVAHREVEAVDLQADYVTKLGSAGELRAYAVASVMPTNKLQTLPGAAYIDRVGFDDGTLLWRGNGGLTWTKGGWTVGWNAQFYDAYKAYSSTDTFDTVNAAGATIVGSATPKIKGQGSDTIPSQMYHDLIVSYRTEAEGIFGNAALANTTISLGIQNIFDKSPPIVATSGSVGGYSQYGDPRLRRFTLALRKSF